MMQLTQINTDYDIITAFMLMLGRPITTRQFPGNCLYWPPFRDHVNIPELKQYLANWN